MIYRFADCELDVSRLELRRKGAVQLVEPQVFDLLQHLVERQQQFVSKDDIFAAIWKGRIVSDATLASRVKAARQAIGDNGTEQRVIRTVHGRGLRFVAAVTCGATASRDTSVAAEVTPPNGPGAEQPGALEPALPERPSIAVLPFSLIGTDEESGYFAEGVADDIITELSRDKDLFVVARQSSFHVARETVASDAVGRALGVRHILTGAVRRAGDRLRISVHLIACETGSEVWADRYDRRLEDLFEVQLDIARTVTATIAGRLTALAEKANAAKTPESFDAYDHVLRAERHLQRYTREDYAQAREHLGHAIRIDPNYARAHSLLCIASVYEWFWDMTESGLSDILRVGEVALALDDQDARTHLALGLAQLFMRRHDRAVHHFDRAVTLNPNDGLIAAEHGRLLMYLDRPEEGLRRVREAMRHNPFHPSWYKNIEGRCLHTAARYEEAIAAFEGVDAPQFWIEAYLAACHAACGRAEAASRHRERLLEMRPEFRLTPFRRFLPYRSAETLERFLDTFRKAGIED